MFEDRFMDFRGFQNDLNIRQASDHRRFADFGTAGEFQDTNPFLKQSDNGLDLCKKLSKMGISCDMSIWSRPDPVDFGSRTTLYGSSGFDQNLSEASSRTMIHDGFRNVSSVSSAFLQNNNFHGVSSPGEIRLLGVQDSSINPNGFQEMMALRRSQTDFLLMNGPIKLPPCPRSVSIGNDALKRSSMFEGDRVSQTLAAMEGSGAFYPEDSTMMRRCFKEDELKFTNGLPQSLVSMVKIFGSVNLMAKDQMGCRVLQKLIDQGTFLDTKVIFLEIIDHVVELSTDPFGNYLVQRLLDTFDEEQRTLIVSVLTSNPMELTKICLNTYGTRVVQKMIETVKTKQQILMVKLGLKSSFLALVKDLNGNHVIQSCLQSLSPNDSKFVLDAATRYCAEIATHRHGCCVLQCCLSNSVGPQRERLVTEISRNSFHLSQDPYGNYVVQYLIEQQVSPAKLLHQFRLHYVELATQKFSSHVIEKCLRKYPESRGEIVRELLSFPNFEQLLQDPFANYVIQTALTVTKGAIRARLVEKVDKFGKLLRSSPYCKKIFSKTILRK